MHRILRDSLPTATASNRFVVALNMDIRGFTSRSGPGMESAEAALFLKLVYRKLLEEYFQAASFWKSTGDGLLVIYEHGDDGLPSALGEAVDIAMSVVEEFPTFAAGDPRINFEVPTEVGFGIAYGAASRLETGDLILDFFGKPLNLASRLMDLARPKGIVVDDVAVLGPETRRQFVKKSAFLKGIAESEPKDVYLWRKYTRLPPIAGVPLVEPEWVRMEPRPATLNRLRKDAENDVQYTWTLPQRPVGDQVDLTVMFPRLTPSGGKGAGILTDTLRVGREYEVLTQRGKTKVRIRTAKLVALLEGQGVKGPWKVILDLAYPTPPRARRRRRPPS